MKVYGYQENQEVLLSLEEISLQCTIEELEKVINFLINTKEEHSAVYEKADMCHSHLKDWDATWKKGQPDIVIVTKNYA
ncbi:MAG: hypothetical protein HDR02_00170 [Lachnospiraceae bacterium]|nr:hypothetical protein [Lachnospiraceae bacterium]